MGRNNTFVYLKSNNGVLDDVSRYYRFDFVNPITCNRKKELINVRVCEAEIPVSYYNINSTNNSFKLSFTLADGNNGSFFKTFDDGNYNSDTLIAELNALADITAGSSTVSMVVSLTEITFKIKILLTSTSSEFTGVVFDTDVTCEKVLGITKQTFSASGIQKRINAEAVIDLNTSNNIYVETDLSLPSLDTDGKKKGILGKIQMAGDFFEIVHWSNNTDADITLDRKHYYLDHINLRLVGEDTDKNIDFNGAEWTMTLLFSFIDKYGNGLGDEPQDGEMHQINLITGNSVYGDAPL